MIPRRRLSPKARASILSAHGNVCSACGASGPLELDHILPLALGGEGGPGNLIPLCAPCHRGAGAKTAKDVGMIAKAKRQARFHQTGRGKARKGRPLKGKGFTQWRSMSGEIRRRK